MGSQLSSGKVTATGTTTITAFTNSGMVAVSGARTGTGTTTLYTVPANHTARVYAATVWNTKDGTNTSKAYIQVNGVTWIQQEFYFGATDTTLFSGTSSISISPYYVEITAGQTITLIEGQANGDCGGTVWYTEHDV